MAGVKVDPPPLVTPVVDIKTGYPTRALSDFLHRLWLRTGGNDDTSDYILKLMTGSSMHGDQVTDSQGANEQTIAINSGISPAQVDDQISVVLGLLNRNAGNEEALHAVGMLASMMQTMQSRYSGEVVALRQEIEEVKSLVASGAFTRSPY